MPKTAFAQGIAFSCLPPHSLPALHAIHRSMRHISKDEYDAYWVFSAFQLVVCEEPKLSMLAKGALAHWFWNGPLSNISWFKQIGVEYV